MKSWDVKAAYRERRAPTRREYYFLTRQFIQCNTCDGLWRSEYTPVNTIKTLRYLGDRCPRESCMGSLDYMFKLPKVHLNPSTGLPWGAP